MRVVGANSFGIACPRTGLNATLAPAMVATGKIGILSQSGALLTALLSQEHWAEVGCSASPAFMFPDLVMLSVNSR